MSGAAAVLLINLVVAGLLAASFAMVAVYDRKQTAAPWLAGAYGLGAVYYCVELAIATFGAVRPAVVASFATMLLAMLSFNVGIARKFETRLPWRLLGGIFFASLVACDIIQDMPRESFSRMLIYQTPYFLMQATGAWILWSARSRARLDTLLMWLLAASSLQFLSKPFLSELLGGTGATAQSYLYTQYALASQSIGTIFAIAIALLFLVILARDIIAAVTKLSNTDALSGLLNRGGFERKARAMMLAEQKMKRPMALVICDLDHFKAINDTFGHASGDSVIRTFAGFLRTVTVGDYFAGRIGGEEFAIMLPGTNLVTARLFAEAARSALSRLPVEGLPEGMRFTASFGVAELASGEDLSELLSRADRALYEAKENGRDRVRAAQPEFDGRRALSAS